MMNLPSEILKLFPQSGYFFSAPELTPEQKQTRDFLLKIFQEYQNIPARKREKWIAKILNGKTLKIDLRNRTDIQPNELELLFNSTKNIDKLDLYFSSFSEEILLSSLKYLKANSPNLKTLNVVGSMITMQGMKELLGAFPNLKELYIENYEVGSQEYQEMLCNWIKNNPSLEIFCGMSVSNLAQMEQLVDTFPATLKGVQIGIWTYPANPDPNIMKIGMEKLAAKCKELQRIEIAAARETITLDNFMKLPVQFPNLSFLKFGESSLTSEQIVATYKSWKGMRVLNLSGTDINDQDFYTLLMSYPNLEEIDIDFAPKLTPKGVAKALEAYATKNSSLKLINLPRNDEFKLDEKGIDPVIQALKPFLPNLHRFSLPWTEINDESFNFIVENLKGGVLKEFSVIMPDKNFQSKIKDATMLQGIIAIGKNCPKVKSLVLNGNVFYDVTQLKKDFSAISTAYKGLRELDLDNFPNQFDSDDTIPLLQFIDNNPKLTAISAEGFLDQAFVDELKKLRPEIDQKINFTIKTIK